MSETYITSLISHWLIPFTRLAYYSYAASLSDVGKSAISHDQAAYTSASLLVLVSYIEAINARLKWKMWNCDYNGVAVKYDRDQFLQGYNSVGYRELLKLAELEWDGADCIDEMFIARNVIAHNHIWTFMQQSDPARKNIMHHDLGIMNKKYREHVDVDTCATYKMGLSIIPGEFSFDMLGRCCRLVDDYLSQWARLKDPPDHVICRNFTSVRLIIE